MIIQDMQIEELEIELSKYKHVSLNQAINHTRKEFFSFIEMLLESGISKHVIYQQLLENAILAEYDLRKNYKTDNHTIEIIQNSARMFGTEFLKKQRLL